MIMFYVLNQFYLKSMFFSISCLQFHVLIVNPKRRDMQKCKRRIGGNSSQKSFKPIQRPPPILPRPFPKHAKAIPNPKTPRRIELQPRKRQNRKP